MANSSYLELESLQTKIDSFHTALIDRLKKTKFYTEEENETTGQGHSQQIDLRSYKPTECPLNIPYILEMVANYLPMQDVRSCMQVCRLWSREMGRCFLKRKKLFVTTANKAEAEALLKSKKEGNYVCLSTLCLYRVTSADLIGTRLLTSFGKTLSGLKLEECDINAAALYQILHFLAPNLEVLCVSQRVPQIEGLAAAAGGGGAGGNPNGPPPPILIVHPIIRVSTFAQIKMINPRFQLPKLKKLQWYERGGQVGLEEIIQCCPNLVELDYENCPHPDVSNFQGLTWDSLRYLCLSPTEELRGQYFDVLSTLNLKVSKVTFYQLHPGGRKRMEKLKKFLRSISNTLECLYLYQHTNAQVNYEPNYASCFPVKLPHLVNLVVEPGLITSIKMLSSIPKLKRFKCKFRRSEDWEAVLQKTLPPPQQNLKDINVGSVDCTVLSKMSTIFPSLTNLELNASKLDDEALRVLIKGFPSLKHLKIFKCRSATGLLITDSGITGIPAEDFPKILESKDLQNFDTTALRKFPYLGDLRCLYGVEFETLSSDLTDLSTFFGFCCLTELRFLSIPNSQVSDKSLEWISQKLPYLLILGVQNCSKISEVETKKLQTKRPELMINVFSILNDLGEVFTDEVP